MFCNTMLAAAAPFARRSSQRWTLFHAGTRQFGNMRGTVKFFNPERGFGFIVSEEKDYFVHYTSIDSPAGTFKSLGDGEEVEFDVEQDQTGKLRAVRVTGPGGQPVKGSQRPRMDVPS
mmetsp:Transcript_131108/g.261651  ORF Transcript_131108/g.261651 Transcript_131108/m.261651 type:complete len:118 (+) Transcript_131108:57-410(+)